MENLASVPDFERELPPEKEGYNHRERIGENLFIVTEERHSFVDAWIEKDGKEIANLRDFIPKYVQVRVDWFPEPEDALKQEGSSSFNQLTKEIKAGKWEGPKTLLDLLHEAGHTHELLRLPEIRSFIRVMADTASPLSHGVKEKVELAAQYLEEASIAERNAWAFALKAIRKIEQENGVNILFGENMYKDVDDLKEDINQSLSSYREYSQNLAKLIKRHKFFIKKPFTWVDELADGLFDKPKNNKAE